MKPTAFFIVLLLSLSLTQAYKFEISDKWNSRHDGVYRYDDGQIIIYNVEFMNLSRLMYVTYHELGHAYFREELTTEQKGRYYTQYLEQQPYTSKYQAEEYYAEQFAQQLLKEGGWK